MKVGAKLIQSCVSTLYKFCITFCIESVSPLIQSSYRVDIKLIQRSVSTLYQLCIKFSNRLCINFHAKFIQSQNKVDAKFKQSCVSTSYQVFVSTMYQFVCKVCTESNKSCCKVDTELSFIIV
jgi:hypothetical protein